MITRAISSTGVKLLFICISLFFAGCAASQNAQTTNLPLQTKWILEDIDGKGVIDFAQSWIMFSEDGMVTGSGGCNRFRGSYSFDNNQLKTGPLASTRMSCAEAVNTQEFKFLEALGAPLNIRNENSLLFMKNNNHSLRFSR